MQKNVRNEKTEVTRLKQSDVRFFFLAFFCIPALPECIIEERGTARAPFYLPLLYFILPLRAPLEYPIKSGGRKNIHLSGCC